jgi:hypothetical protein
MAHCVQCEKSVLTYLALDAQGSERRVCVHCDTALNDRLEWVGPGELEQSGYYFGDPPSEKSCNSGCGSCATKKS